MRWAGGRAAISWGRAPAVKRQPILATVSIQRRRPAARWRESKAPAVAPSSASPRDQAVANSKAISSRLSQWIAIVMGSNRSGGGAVRPSSAVSSGISSLLRRAGGGRRDGDVTEFIPGELHPGQAAREAFQSAL